MTREELIEIIVEDTKKLSPAEKKARRKKWAKRAAVGVGVAGLAVAGAHYGPKVRHALSQRKIRDRVYTTSSTRSGLDEHVGRLRRCGIMISHHSRIELCSPQRKSRDSYMMLKHSER